MVPRPSSSPPRLASLLRRSAPFYRGPPAHKTRRDGIGYHGARGRTTPFPRRRIRKEEAPNVRVALFITCFNDTLFPETGKATVEILERLGVELEFPLDQTCCGQMHFNTGYQREAIPLVRRFTEVFGQAECVVTPSASCAGMVRDLYPRAAELAGDDRLAEAVAALAPRVFELSEFLVDELGVVDV